MATQASNCPSPMLSRTLIVLLLAAVFPTPAALGSQGGQTPPQKTQNQQSAPAFSEADAARLLEELQQALEGDDQRRLLKLFDPRKMPNFAAFRDQVAEFFEKYQAFRFRYHIAQISGENEIAMVLAEVELELTPAGAYVPDIRRTAQLRLVLGWNGKAWKIVDWSPASILE